MNCPKNKIPQNDPTGTSQLPQMQDRCKMSRTPHNPRLILTTRMTIFIKNQHHSSWNIEKEMTQCHVERIAQNMGHQRKQTAQEMQKSKMNTLIWYPWKMYVSICVQRSFSHVLSILHIVIAIRNRTVSGGIDSNNNQIIHHHHHHYYHHYHHCHYCKGSATAMQDKHSSGRQVGQSKLKAWCETSREADSSVVSVPKRVDTLLKSLHHCHQDILQLGPHTPTASRW